MALGISSAYGKGAVGDTSNRRFSEDEDDEMGIEEGGLANRENLIYQSTAEGAGVGTAKDTVGEARDYEGKMATGRLSQAQTQLRQGLGESRRQQAAMAAGGGAIGQRAAMLAGGEAGAKVSGQSAQVRAAEEAGARQQTMGALGQQVGAEANRDKLRTMQSISQAQHHEATMAENRAQQEADRAFSMEIVGAVAGTLGSIFSMSPGPNSPGGGYKNPDNMGYSGASRSGGLGSMRGAEYEGSIHGALGYETRMQRAREDEHFDVPRGEGSAEPAPAQLAETPQNPFYEGTLGDAQDAAEKEVLRREMYRAIGKDYHGPAGQPVSKEPPELDQNLKGQGGATGPGRQVKMWDGTPRPERDVTGVDIETTDREALDSRKLLGIAPGSKFKDLSDATDPSSAERGPPVGAGKWSGAGKKMRGSFEKGKSKTESGTSKMISGMKKDKSGGASKAPDAAGARSPSDKVMDEDTDVEPGDEPMGPAPGMTAEQQVEAEMATIESEMALKRPGDIRGYGEEAVARALEQSYERGAVEAGSRLGRKMQEQQGGPRAEAHGFRQPPPEAIDRTLEGLHTYDYTYKDDDDLPGRAQGMGLSQKGSRRGPMAEELSATPLGRKAVTSTPQGDVIEHDNYLYGVVTPGLTRVNDKVESLARQLAEYDRQFQRRQGGR